MKKLPLSASVVIPNYNGRVLLEKNLPQVLNALSDNEIIVVDDASTDDSVLFLEKHYPNIRLVKQLVNRGFASSVNAGVAAAGGDIVLLLNTDVSPEKDFLQPLLLPFHDEAMFAVGCLEKSHEKEKVELRGRGVARWQRGLFVHNRGEIGPSTTAWVTGGSAAFRRNLWVKLGGMCELYNPYYWEDIDLSYSALKAGYRILIANSSVVHHFHDQGSIIKSANKLQIATIAYRNQFIFMWKNVSDLSLLLTHLIWLPVHLIKAMIRSDWSMIRGFVLAVLVFPRVIKARISVAKCWRRSDRNLFPLF